MSARTHESLSRWAKNPFFVLELGTNASATEIERAGKLLLGKLKIGAESARWVETPYGRVERTEDDVRQAIADLQQPAQRAAAELVAHFRASPVATRTAPKVTMPDAVSALGYVAREDLS